MVYVQAIKLCSIVSINTCYYYLCWHHAWAKTHTGNQQFSGYYFTASWIVSGEQRPYDKKAAYARRVKPDGKVGAFEIVRRVSQINLDGRDVHGGILNKLYLG